MKSRQRDSSSFGLFLDTICNTFGGIVFLAILLAIMIQNQAIVRMSDDHEPHLSAEELRTVTLKLDRLRAEKDALQTTLKTLPGSSANQGDAEYVEALEFAKRKEAELATLLDQHAKLSTQLAKQRESNAEQRQKNERVPADLEAIKNRLKGALAEYTGLVESKQQTLELPRVRTSQTASIVVLVQNDSLFLAKRPSLFESGFNSEQVTTKSLIGGAIRVEPKNGTGSDLTGPVGHGRFKEIVREARQAGHAITLAVWPESYDLFPALKDHMVGENVFYQLWPQSASEKLIVFLGRGASRIQ